MSHRRAKKEWNEETDGAKRDGLLPFEFEHVRLKLGTGEKSQQHHADAREKLNPGFVAAQNSQSDGRAQDQLGDCSHHHFGHRGGDAEPLREHARDQREAKPKRSKRPNFGHVSSSFLSPRSRGAAKGSTRRIRAVSSGSAFPREGKRIILDPAVPRLLKNRLDELRSVTHRQISY